MSHKQNNAWGADEPSYACHLAKFVEAQAVFEGVLSYTRPQSDADKHTSLDLFHARPWKCVRSPVIDPFQKEGKKEIMLKCS